MMRTALLIAGICLLTACKKDKTEEPEPPVEVKRTVEYIVTGTIGPHTTKYRDEDGSIVEAIYAGDVHITKRFTPGDTVLLNCSYYQSHADIKVDGVVRFSSTGVPVLAIGIVP